MVAFVLIVRGPLGAGKTTVAHRLARTIGARVVSIDDLLEQLDWDGGSEALFLKTNRLAAAEAAPILQRETPVVFDGNFYWRSAIDDLLGRVAVPGRVFTLAVPLDVCVERDRTRRSSYGARATREVFEKVGKVSYGTVVDGRKTVDTTVRRIRSLLPAEWIGPLPRHRPPGGGGRRRIRSGPPPVR